jgi:hypothetical protein
MDPPLLSDVEEMLCTPLMRLSIDSNLLVTSDSIVRDELPGMEK